MTRQAFPVKSLCTVDDTRQCGFSGPIGSNQSNFIPSFYFDILIFGKNRNRFVFIRIVCLTQGAYRHHDHPAAGGIREPDVDGAPLLFRRLDTFHLIELLDFALHLTRFRCLCTEPGDISLRLLKLFLLIFIGLLAKLFLLFVLPLIIIVIPVIQGYFPMLQSGDMSHHTVQEHTVVTHYPDGAPIVWQIAFQPGDTVDIEMVRRLIQQQDIGCFQQQPGQQCPHLPTAAESVKRIIQLAGCKTESGEGILHPGFPLSTICNLIPVLQHFQPV